MAFFFWDGECGKDGGLYMPENECGDCGDYGEDIAELKQNVRALQQGKQDKLTAGSGITINGTTISAEGTSYSAADNSLIFTGNKIKVNPDEYYTKSQTNTELANKQDKLTAGDNITINNGVISSTGGDPLIGAMYHVGMQTNTQLLSNTRVHPILQSPRGTDIVTCDLTNAKFRVLVPGTYFFNINLDASDTHTGTYGYIQCHVGTYDDATDTMEDEFYAGKHMIGGEYVGGIYSFAMHLEPGKYYVPTFLFNRYNSNAAKIDFGWIQLVYVGSGE